MRDPNDRDDGAGDEKRLAEHHGKAECHQKRYGQNDLFLGLGSHAFALDVRFEIVFIKLCVDEPSMQLFGAFAEAERGKEQKRNGGDHRQSCSECAEAETDKTDDDPKQFFEFHKDSFLLRLAFANCRLEKKVLYQCCLILPLDISLWLVLTNNHILTRIGAFVNRFLQKKRILSRTH